MQAGKVDFCPHFRAPALLSVRTNDMKTRAGGKAGARMRGRLPSTFYVRLFRLQSYIVRVFSRLDIKLQLCL